MKATAIGLPLMVIVLWAVLPSMFRPVTDQERSATVERMHFEEVHPWGNSRAAMIEGPDRIAIELVEVK